MVTTRDAAVALGRLGGLARRAALTPKQRSDSARKAALSRWIRYRDRKLAQRRAS